LIRPRVSADDALALAAGKALVLSRVDRVPARAVLAGQVPIVHRQEQSQLRDAAKRGVAREESFLRGGCGGERGRVARGRQVELIGEQLELRVGGVRTAGRGLQVLGKRGAVVEELLLLA